MQRPQILTVEDDAAIRRGIVDSLRFAGYQSVRSGHRRRRTGDGHQPLVRPGAVGPGPARPRRSGYLARGPCITAHAAGDHPFRPRRRGRPRGRLAFGGRRLRRQAVQRQGAAGPGRGRAASLARAAARPDARSPCRIALADLARAEVRFADGTRTELSEKEVELLRYLAANSGRAVSRDELLLRVWQISPRGLPTRTIDMHVTRLREKLRDDPAEPRVILTVRGKGYMFATQPGVRHETSLANLAGLSPACLLVVTAAVGWLSFRALESEQAEATARAAGALEENARLALWRIDSAVAPLIAQETRVLFCLPLVLFRSASRMARRPAAKPSGAPLAPSPLLSARKPADQAAFRDSSRRRRVAVRPSVPPADLVRASRAASTSSPEQVDAEPRAARRAGQGGRRTASCGGAVAADAAAARSLCRPKPRCSLLPQQLC